jgi:3-phosphoshikimate 1-carboxyvinyltransferase
VQKASKTFMTTPTPKPECYFVERSSFSGIAYAPPSKSHTLRAILLASLAEGISYIEAPLLSSDSMAMMRACELLGAKISLHKESNTLEISGIALSHKNPLSHALDVIQAENSGIILRFLAAIAALSPSNPIVITGDASIRSQRPIAPLLSALRQLGASAISTKGDGFAPLIIQGPWRGGIASLCGNDSQPISALLIAAALAPCDSTTLQVENPGELPWIGVTLRWLDFLGLHYKHNKDFTYYHIPGKQKINAFRYRVPGDQSSAAFPIAAAVITGSPLLMKNFDVTDSQGDKEAIFYLQRMGAPLLFDSANQQILVEKSPKCNLKGNEIDLSLCIDALPILSVVAAFASGKTLLKNGAVAKEKECNRIACMAEELTKLGATVAVQEDGLEILGGRESLRSAKVLSHQDHRVAMALATAGFALSGITTIHGTECVAKTFPTFAEEMAKLGGKIRR